jgi:hypothetical protein
MSRYCPGSGVREQAEAWLQRSGLLGGHKAEIAAVRSAIWLVILNEHLVRDGREAPCGVALHTTSTKIGVVVLKRL